MADLMFKNLGENTSPQSTDWFATQNSSDVTQKLSLLNAQIKILSAGGTAWTTWSPTWTNVTGGATTYAKYTQIGKTVYFRVKYTLAGAGVSGEVAFSPPVTLNSDYVAESYIDATATFNDSGTAYTGVVRVATTTALTIRTIHTDGARATNQATSATSPFTFAAGDIIEAHGTYEVA